MKTVLLALFVSVAGFAQVDTNTTTRLSCVVPVETGTPAITVAIEAVEESQGDFLSVVINEPAKELAYYNQLEKGSVRDSLAQGQLVTLVINEGARMDNGAVRGAGFLVLSKNNGAYEGFASLNDTFYPLVCK